MQAFHIKAVRRADEVHLERQLPHLINGQCHIGGVALHRDILRRKDIADLIPQLQGCGHGRGIGQLAVDLHRGHDAGHLIQFARGAAQRDLSGHSSGLIEHIAVGDRHGGGVHRDREGLFAHLIKDNINRIGAFDRTLDVPGEVGRVGHAGLQAQRHLARAADTGIAGIDHDVGVLNVADDRAIALDLDGNALEVRLFHDVQPLRGVGGGTAGVVDGYLGHCLGALGVDVDRYNGPSRKAHDERQHHHKDWVVPEGARSLGHCPHRPRGGGLIRAWHGSVHLPCAAAFAAARPFRPRLPQGERSPPAAD